MCRDKPPKVREENDEEKKTLVVLYHDESIYSSNEGQTWMWGEEERRLGRRSNQQCRVFSEDI